MNINVFRMGTLLGLAGLVAGCGGAPTGGDRDLRGKMDSAAMESAAVDAATPLECGAQIPLKDLFGETPSTVRFAFDLPESVDPYGYIYGDGQDVMTLDVVGLKGGLWIKDLNANITAYRRWSYQVSHQRVDVEFNNSSRYEAYVYGRRTSEDAKLIVNCIKGPTLHTARGRTVDNVTVELADAFANDDNFSDHIMVGYLTGSAPPDIDVSPAERIADAKARYSWQRLGVLGWYDYGKTEVLGRAHSRVDETTYAGPEGLTYEAYSDFPYRADSTADDYSTNAEEDYVILSTEGRQRGLHDLVAVAPPKDAGTYRLVLTYYHAAMLFGSAGSKRTVGLEYIEHPDDPDQRLTVSHQVTSAPVYYGTRARQCSIIADRYAWAVSELTDVDFEWPTKTTQATPDGLFCGSATVGVSFIPDGESSSQVTTDVAPYFYASRDLDILPRMWSGECAYVDGLDEWAPSDAVASLFYRYQIKNPLCTAAELPSCEEVMPCLQPAIDEANAIVIDSTMNGRSKTIVVGDTIDVQLSGNPTTGYDWHLLASNRSFPLLKEQYVVDEPQMVGSGGTYHFYFKAGSLAAGDTFELEFANYRSWEGPELAIETFSVTIVVPSAL